MEKQEKVISANRLLDREPDEAYLSEWTSLLQREAAAEIEKNAQSVVIFRLTGEWLAIATDIFAEIAHTRIVHRVPHRSGPLLLGVVNLRGHLRLLISLHKLLDLEEETHVEKVERKQYARLVAIRKGADFWTFPVDEVYGNYVFAKADLQNVPVTITKSTANFLRGVVAWEGRSVGVIDEELLFQSLKRSLT